MNIYLFICSAVDKFNADPHVKEFGEKVVNHYCVDCRESAVLWVRSGSFFRWKIVRLLLMEAVF